MVVMVMVCCRYAEFSAAMVGINETFPHEQMNRLLALLQVLIMFFSILPILGLADIFGKQISVSSVIGQMIMRYIGTGISEP